MNILWICQLAWLSPFTYHIAYINSKKPNNYFKVNFCKFIGIVFLLLIFSLGKKEEFVFNRITNFLQIFSPTKSAKLKQHPLMLDNSHLNQLLLPIQILLLIESLNSKLPVILWNYPFHYLLPIQLGVKMSNRLPIMNTYLTTKPAWIILHREDILFDKCILLLLCINKHNRYLLSRIISRIFICPSMTDKLPSSTTIRIWHF